MALARLIDPFNEAEPFAVEQHIFGELAEAGKISPMSLAPVRQGSVAFTFIVRERRIDFVERSLG